MDDSPRFPDDYLRGRAIAEHLGMRLAAARRKANLSLSEAAHRANLSETEFRALEAGEGDPTVSQMARVARALDIEARELLEGAPDA